MTQYGIIDKDGVVRSSIIAGLPDAEQLLARRAVVVKELAPLRALFGGNGYMAERKLKMVEARLENVIRTRQWAEYNADRALKAEDRKGVDKPTEGSIGAEVRNHEDYISAVTEQLVNKDRWVQLEEDLNDIEWRLRIRAGDGYIIAAEIKLQ